MIISHRWRFVYIGPPKTASTALHRWLSQPAFCPERWTPKQQDQHSIDIPLEANDYFTFASVRNPMDRAVSLWAHSQSQSSLMADNYWPMSFEEFVLEYQPSADWFYSISQSELLAPLRLDALVRFERLAEDLLALPPIAEAIQGEGELEPLAHLNQTTHRPWRELCTPRIAEAIFQRWKHDWRLPLITPGGPKSYLCSSWE